MNTINGVMRSIDLADRFAVPDFSQAHTLLIGSDYSGQHSTSAFEALGFLVADADQLRPWLGARGDLRMDKLPDGRRMSFKNLSDKKRAMALPGFLDAAGEIHGLLLVMLVDKRIKTLFRQSPSDGEGVNGDEELLSSWQPRTEEKLLRICHILAMLVAGLSHPGQNVVWFSDQDEIAANEQRLRELTEASGRIMSGYLEHSLGHLRVGTTASDSGNRELEDYVAIADLAAGALCEFFNAHRRASIDIGEDVFMPNQEGMALKIKSIIWWLSKKSTLKKIVLSVESIPASVRVKIRSYDF